ncbi:MAG: transmembrane 220 family protein [Saprospiraceae bacterium]|nr:transmembrane 220 family protein [Saprospiraceae bacterium]
MKIVHLLVAILFVLFAYWQINDPDPIGWIVIYLGVSLVAIRAFSGRESMTLALAGSAAAFFGIVLLVPDFVSWLTGGMPTITGSMQAESPHIELVREFLGFFLAGIAYALYFRKAVKKNTCFESTESRNGL